MVIQKVVGASPGCALTLASKLFRPVVNRPHNTTTSQEFACHSHRLFLDNAIVDRNMGVSGTMHLLPAGQLALSKLIRIIDEEMGSIGAQRLALSSFCPQRLLEKSGRFDLMKKNLFTTKDNNDNLLCLAPTHEESVTSLFLDKLNFGPKNLPFLLYQISTKFRDEALPRYGLLRSKEFLMKDLYSFHESERCAQETYDLVNESYARLFGHRLGLKFFRVEATSGAMGGTSSHEFHLENACGQDEIFYCEKCRTGINTEVLVQNGTLTDDQVHPPCGSPMAKLKTIEIGHTFLLGTKYSAALEAGFSSGQKSEKPTPFHMACFGIGVSRLLAAGVDCMIEKSGQQKELRWPRNLAPYNLCLVPPKKGSKEETAGAGDFAKTLVENLCREFRDIENFNLLYDDRNELTVGRRFNDAKILGCPFIIVANKTCVGTDIPRTELFNLNENSSRIVSHAELFGYLRENIVSV